LWLKGFADTANAYNGGQSKEVLGRYIAKHPDIRARAALATKAGGTMPPMTRTRRAAAIGDSPLAAHVAPHLNDAVFDLIDVLADVRRERHDPGRGLAWVGPRRRRRRTHLGHGSWLLRSSSQ